MDAHDLQQVVWLGTKHVCVPLDAFDKDFNRPVCVIVTSVEDVDWAQPFLLRRRWSPDRHLLRKMLNGSATDQDVSRGPLHEHKRVVSGRSSPVPMLQDVRRQDGGRPSFRGVHTPRHGSKRNRTNTSPSRSAPFRSPIRDLPLTTMDFERLRFDGFGGSVLTELAGDSNPAASVVRQSARDPAMPCLVMRLKTILRYLPP